ncbi:MAG: AAA family ATPase, partial [Sulfurovum sp.]|nr:AAA family ATPase [Sulfurovum sp.]
MKINSIELKNFKFHKELNFNIEKKNCIIYGENGTGKSSVYWSLVSVFKKDLIDISDFKNR